MNTVDNNCSNKKEIVFFVMSLTQPRCIKRVTSFRDAGYNCIVYGYRRGVYDVNFFPNDIPVHVLGEVKNRDYRNNFGSVKSDISMIYQQHGDKTIYYSFGFAPSLFFAIKKTRFIYECSDVWYAYPKFNKIRWILKLIDKWLIRRSKITVMTSGGFAEYFDVINNDKVVVLPNRVSPRLDTAKRQSLSALNTLSFGFVGSIRYQNVFRFAEVIGRYFPNYSFHFYGSGDSERLNRVEKIVSNYKNTYYHGKFKSPEDLPQIYETLDVVVACYDNTSLNEQIAEPNKLYESLFFCKPIIVSPNTYLSKQVQQLGCGFVVNADNEDSVKNFIASLGVDEINCISSKELSIPLTEIVDDPSALISKVQPW